MKESKIEKAFCDQVEDQGGKAIKFVSPNFAKVPDRLVLLPIPKKQQDIVSKYVYFAELKAPNKKPDAGQYRRHEWLKSLGFRVEVIDNERKIQRFGCTRNI